MSFREKTAWISLVTTLLIWGQYFARVTERVWAGESDAGTFIGLFVGTTITAVVVQVVLTIVIAVIQPAEANAAADERERLIELKSSHAAYALLSVLVVTLAIATPFLIGVGPQVFAGSTATSGVVLTANAMIFALVLAELLRSLWQIVLFRRMA